MLFSFCDNLAIFFSHCTQILSLKISKQNHNAELLIHKDSILHLVKDNTALQQTVQQQATDLKQQASEMADLKARLIKLEQGTTINLSISSAVRSIYKIPH